MIHDTLIHFDHTQVRYDGMHGETVNFQAMVGEGEDERLIPCRVSREALMDALLLTRATGADLVDAYRSQAHRVQAIARRKIRDGQFDAQGRVLVTSAELNGVA